MPAWKPPSSCSPRTGSADYPPWIPTAHLVGVLSRTDLLLEGGPVLSQLLRGRASGLWVGELMSSPPLTVSLTATLAEAARIMRDERVHRLVVVNEQGAPIGVLSATDYVTLIADG